MPAERVRAARATGPDRSSPRLRAGDLQATGLEIALEQGGLVVPDSDGVTATRDPEGELRETGRMLSVIRRHPVRPARETVKLPPGRRAAPVSRLAGSARLAAPRTTR
jgi:hypothetical protein